MLKNEVELMAKMAKTIDGFTQHQTRLAVVIDGLDSCEQDKVLQMLDTVSEAQGSGVKGRRGKDKIYFTVCPRRRLKFFFDRDPQTQLYSLRKERNRRLD